MERDPFKVSGAVKPFVEIHERSFITFGFMGIEKVVWRRLEKGSFIHGPYLILCLKIRNPGGMNYRNNLFYIY